MKKLLSIVIAICISAGISTIAYAVDYGKELKSAPIKTYEQKFSDVPQDYWAFRYIAEMAERGVLSGYPDGKFYPNSQVTRAEFAKIMTVAAGLGITQPTMQIFSDVKITEWYAPYVHTAKEYLSAYNQNGSSYYLPNAPALREDIAVALVKLKGYSITGADMTALLRMFSDYQSISESAKIYVASAVENGLISGYDDGTFRGQNGITRAEAATLLWRAYQYGNANKTYDNILGNISEKVSDEENAETTVIKKEETEFSEPIVEEVKKPYVMRELASANLESSSFSTNDDNNIYYIDEGDNCVYKVNVSTGKKTKYLDTNELSYSETEEYEINTIEEVTKIVETGEYEEVGEEITETIVDEETGEETEVTKTIKKKVPITEEVMGYETTTVIEEAIMAEYTSFVPVQVFYDRENDRLLLNGYYENLVEAGKTPSIGKEYQFLYDITNGRCDVITSNPYHEINRRFMTIKEVLNDKYMVMCNAKSPQQELFWKLNTQTAVKESMYVEERHGFNFGCLKYDNSLFMLEQASYSGMIYNYDFSEGELKPLSDTLYFDAFGTKDDCYYFWNEDGLMFKISVRTKMTTVLDINTKSENVEFEDMGNMKNIDEQFFVIDDETFVFYDTSMKAFRILEKN